MASRSFFAWKMLVVAQSQDERNHMRIHRRGERQKFDAFLDLGENEFQLQYRLSKDAVMDLCQDLESMTGLKGTQQISLQEKVLTALFYYASGSHQRPVGVALKLSQKICSKYIEEVTSALNHPAMLEKYIKFPNTSAARQNVSQRFYAKYGIPGVVGCIDGCHFRIFTPHTEVEHIYYCRKHYHSLNVQMVCDYECRILSVNAKFGGHNHDSFIWQNSQINKYMQDLHQQRQFYCLLGDSGYPQRPWLMTPYLRSEVSTPEIDYYNKKHGKTRVLIENTFGRLKNRWRCLGMDHIMHYKPDKCAQIVQACCVLHNMALQYRIPDPVAQNLSGSRTDLPQPVQLLIENNTSSESSDLERGRAYRNRLAARLWAENH